MTRRKHAMGLHAVYYSDPDVQIGLGLGLYAELSGTEVACSTFGRECQQGAEYCDDHVCLCVCQSAGEHIISAAT